MNNIVLEYQNVSKVYKNGESEVYALNGVTVSFSTGELTALVGPSGSGKSTMQHLGAGFDKASGGAIFLMGKDLASYKEKELSWIRNQHIGFIFQSFNLIPVMNVLENIMYPANVYGAPFRFDGSVKERVFYLLNKVGLDDQAKKKPHQLSGGQRQRVAIARSLMNNPDLIFADEPTANLDHKTGFEILELLVELNRDMKTTILFSTHDPAIMECARRIVELKDGCIVGDKL
ncbi:MAG: ABC transporter ATP-binding protein [Spirochaetaceae bacterium]|jgi:putative ABC transport system ATP-binding protein|nr:ABC transporter ATP-binding protein [Spirochaetaceae bacterium]